MALDGSNDAEECLTCCSLVGSAPAATAFRPRFSSSCGDSVDRYGFPESGDLKTNRRSNWLELGNFKPEAKTRL